MNAQTTNLHLTQQELIERWNSIRWSTGHNNGALYAFFPEETYTEDSGLYVSVDDGKNWNMVAMAFVEGEICDLVAHPTNPQILALTTTAGVYMSNDTGEHFSQLCDWGNSYVAFDMLNPNLIYYGGQQHFISDTASVHPPHYKFQYTLLLLSVVFGALLTTGITFAAI
jgi:hypothetical protein